MTYNTEEDVDSIDVMVGDFERLYTLPTWLPDSTSPSAEGDITVSDVEISLLKLDQEIDELSLQLKRFGADVPEGITHIKSLDDDNERLPSIIKVPHKNSDPYSRSRVLSTALVISLVLVSTLQLMQYWFEKLIGVGLPNAYWLVGLGNTAFFVGLYYFTATTRYIKINNALVALTVAHNMRVRLYGLLKTSDFQKSKKKIAPVVMG